MSESLGKTPEIELLPPEGGQTGTRANSQVLATFGTEEQIAEAIKRDIEVSERYGKFSLFLGVRIGLALTIVKDNGNHGDLQRFIDKHFAERARRSLTNYMRVAGLFLTECKLRDKRFRLTNTAAVAPILQEQLDLFTSPDASKLEGVLKKLVNWAGKRSLQDIYKALAKGEQNLPPKNFGNAGARNHKLPIDAKRDDALITLRDMETFMVSEDWNTLHDDELARLDSCLSSFHEKVNALGRHRAAEQEKINRRARR